MLATYLLAIPLLSLSMTSSATPSSDQDYFSALLKRQAPGTPSYDCHFNCGTAITLSRGASPCTDSTFLADYAACLVCSGPDNQDIWKMYGKTLGAAGEKCGLSITPVAGSTASPTATDASAVTESTSSASASSTASGSVTSAAATTTSAPASTSVTASTTSSSAVSSTAVVSPSATTSLALTNGANTDQGGLIGSFAAIVGVAVAFGF